MSALAVETRLRHWPQPRLALCLCDRVAWERDELCVPLLVMSLEIALFGG